MPLLSPVGNGRLRICATMVPWDGFIREHAGRFAPLGAKLLHRASWLASLLAGGRVDGQALLASMAVCPAAGGALCVGRDPAAPAHRRFTADEFHARR